MERGDRVRVPAGTTVWRLAPDMNGTPGARCVERVMDRPIVVKVTYHGDRFVEWNMRQPMWCRTEDVEEL